MCRLFDTTYLTTYLMEGIYLDNRTWTKVTCNRCTLYVIVAAAGCTEDAPFELGAFPSVKLCRNASPSLSKIDEYASPDQGAALVLPKPRTAPMMRPWAHCASKTQNVQPWQTK